MEAEEFSLGGFESLIGEDAWSIIQKEDEAIKASLTPAEEGEELTAKEPKTKEKTPEEQLDEIVEEQKKKGAKKPKEEEEPAEEATDNQGMEQSLVKGMVEAYFERNGWSTEGVDIPTDVDGFMDYIDTIIEHESRPTFASTEVERINKFVENGGDIRDYLERVSDGVDYDLTSAIDQKRAISDLLRRHGHTSEQIKRKLNKYEEAGILEDEAAEAEELLRDIFEREKISILEQAERSKAEAKKQQEEFRAQVMSTIRQMKDIHGVTLTEADKKKLLEYGFEPDANGSTAFAKKFQSDVRYLIQAMYLTMNEEKFIESTKKAGEKSATEKLKEMLRNNVEHKSTIRQQHTGGGKRFWEEL